MTRTESDLPHQEPVWREPGESDQLDLGVIGNGTIAAVIDAQGAYQWLCLPRLDGEPVVDTLLGGNARLAVDVEDLKSVRQYYRRNTAVLVTEFTDQSGARLSVTDFMPRFTRRGRTFRPTSLVRRIRIESGTPRIRLHARFSSGWGRAEADARRGVSHIRYTTDDNSFRLTTDAPIDFVQSGQAFRLERDLTLIIGPDETLAQAPGELGRDWQERTEDYWRSWSRSLAIPYEWQSAVIRAAITLKLCIYEETGGIVAALTTSIPEHGGSERNWDYRYCWLRDAYFVVTALNRLASMASLEDYVRYVRNIIAVSRDQHSSHGEGFIQPVFGIGLETELTEHIVDTLPGFKGNTPVRRGNQAFEHVQHDVYGQVLLSASQAFFDTRLFTQCSQSDFEDLESVGERAWQVHDTPDAGIWEFRGMAHVHTSSAIMCWAACDRLARIADHLGLGKRRGVWRRRADIIKDTVLERAYNAKLNAFTAAYGGDTLDASVLLMAEIGFIDPMDERYIGTVEAIDDQLRVGDYVYRYTSADDFGKPETTFTACTFWFIDALHRIGRTEEARAMFETILEQRNHLGLLSEDLDADTLTLWGNFPQTYSLVGIVNSASLLSQDWHTIV